MSHLFRITLTILFVGHCVLLAQESPIPVAGEIPAFLLDRDYRPEIEAIRVDTPPKID